MGARPRDARSPASSARSSVAIGQEMVPAVATLAVIVALRWAVDGERCARATIAYAVALAAGAVVLGAATDRARRTTCTVHCDAISIAQVGALALGGFGLAALAALPGLHSIARRLAAAGGLAAAARRRHRSRRAAMSRRPLRATRSAPRQPMARLGLRGARSRLGAARHAAARARLLRHPAGRARPRHHLLPARARAAALELDRLQRDAGGAPAGLDLAIARRRRRQRLGRGAGPRRAVADVRRAARPPVLLRPAARAP